MFETTPSEEYFRKFIYSEHHSNFLLSQSFELFFVENDSYFMFFCLNLKIPKFVIHFFLWRNMKNRNLKILSTTFFFWRWLIGLLVKTSDWLSASNTPAQARMRSLSKYLEFQITIQLIPFPMLISRLHVYPYCSRGPFPVVPACR